MACAEDVQCVSVCVKEAQGSIICGHMDERVEGCADA